MNVAEARGLARRLLAKDAPQRWDHVKAVAAQSEQFATRVVDGDQLTAAAYLHDIGYASELIDIGFHQIDGARYLRSVGCDEALVNLVAHHSAAAVRAELSGLGSLYRDEFPKDESLPHRELHFCDLAVDVDGRVVDIDHRLINLRRRHADNPPMLRYLDLYESDMRRLVAEMASPAST